MPKFLHNSVEVSAGQALDVWLKAIAEVKAKEAFSGQVYLSTFVHQFADAIYGYQTDVECVALAGIEIQFGATK